LNWKDKYENLSEVQQRLNIGLDSIVFIDDSPFEREQMKAAFPEVRVFDENIFEQLLYLPEFQPEFVTRESRDRTKFYVQEDRRQQAQGTLTKVDFLEQCQFKIGIGKMRPFEVDRVAELIQRTNQLNTSIKRYTKEQIISLGHDQDCDIFVVHVSDKFGDYGLVGVCIGFRRNSIYEIDTLAVKGIGRETADSILLYALGRPVFVVDTYTARIMTRHGLIEPNADYEQLRDLFESNLPEDTRLYNEYHALLVRTGKDFCKPKAKCPGCPLEIHPHTLDVEHF
jgi:FkbH-like protein